MEFTGFGIRDWGFGKAKSKAESRRRVEIALKAVDLLDRADHYPRQLSGGQEQRVGIARAIVAHPKVVVADEPTSALDVVSQRLVLQTLLELRDKFGTAILLVGHDLAVMAQVADRIGILFAGQLVEYGPARAIFKEPAHPYARRLLQAVPSIRVRSDLPEATFPSEADRQHWSDRSIPMRLVGPNHQARCETQ